MIDCMMNGSVGMTIGMGLFCFMMFALTILAAASLFKYLFFSKNSKKHED